MEELEKFINSRKTNYRTLYSLLVPYRNSSDPKQLQKSRFLEANIFIDLESIFQRLYTNRTVSSGETYLDYIKRIDNRQSYRMFASETMNLVAHLRNFFATRLNMYTNIYLFSTNYFDDMLEYDIKKTFSNKVSWDTDFHEVNEIMKHTFNLVKKLVDYVPHVYYFRDFKFDKSLLPYYVMKHEDNSSTARSFIYSNDRIFHQYVNLIDNLYILTHNSNNSKLYHYNNIMGKAYKSDIDPSFIPLIQSLVGLKHPYDMKSVKGLGPSTAIKSIQSVSDYYVNMNQYLELIRNKDKKLKVEDRILSEEELFKNNYEAINIIGKLSKENHDNNLVYIQSNMVELVDPEGIKYINEEIFETYPIMLDFLFKGEEYG